MKPYSYEVTKIELLSGSSQNGTSWSDALNNSISSAKLLENVEKSYDKGVKLLEVSENSSRTMFSAVPGSLIVPPKIRPLHYSLLTTHYSLNPCS